MAYQIKHRNMSEPLTVPITDETRAALAYNVLYAMGDKHVKLLLNGETMGVGADTLYIEDESGKRFRPPLDAEWQGSDADREAIKWAVLDSIMSEKQQHVYYKDADMFTAGYYWEFEQMEAYTAVCFDEADNEWVWAAPVSWDPDKGTEVMNCMKHGLNPDLMLSMDRDGESVSFRPGLATLSSPEGHIFLGKDDADWAVTQSESKFHSDLIECDIWAGSAGTYIFRTDQEALETKLADFLNSPSLNAPLYVALLDSDESLTYNSAVCEVMHCNDGRFDIDFDGITTCQNVTEAANAIHTMLSDYKAQDAENANRIRSNLTLSDADLSFATESELSM